MTARARSEGTPAPARRNRRDPTAGTLPYVVGVGASAGGLEALDRMFSAMPAKTGIAFVLVQHLSPDHKSLMVELLAKKTKMQVVSAEDGMSVKSETVYILPPGKMITIKGGALKLSEKNRRDGLVFPIDVFLNSLAEDQGGMSGAVILSGTGSDGTKGVRAIHEAEGVVLVQDPRTSGFDGMPRSALETGITDASLPPEQIGEHLVAYVRRVIAADGTSLARHKFPADLDRVVSVLLNQTGMDFSGYKKGTLSRRVDRRMRLNHLDRIEDYAILLAGDRQEADNLQRELLVSVTSFFRDAAAFEVLRAKVIAPLVAEQRPHSDALRVWVCGCATGEEAYSVAMLFAEEMRVHGRRDIKIFATDMDKHALGMAGSGVFSEGVAGDIPDALRERYLVQNGSGYRVVPELRHMLVFAPHNVIRDPPFTKLDLVCCRNLLIYLEPNLQMATIRRFQFALRPGGAMFLGGSEGLGAAASDFTALDARARVYRVLNPGLPALNEMSSPAPSRRPALAQGTPRDTRDSMVDDATRTLLQAYCPPTVLVDDKLAIIHNFGGVEKYLKVPEGEATLNVVRHLPRDLGTVVAASVHRCLREGKPINVQPVRMNRQGDDVVQLTFQPTTAVNGDRLVLIAFERPHIEHTGEDVGLLDLQSAAQERIQGLESELRANRESQQAFIEELETTNEELQAANEELLASNEELQSSNEELQSVNEELHTVNAELASKVEELTHTTDDLDNIIEASEIGIILLDGDGVVRRFSPSARNAVNLMERDIGRSITDLSTRFTYPDFIDNVRKVLKDGIPCEREVPAEGERTLLTRIMPYRARQSTFRGAIVTFVDVTPMKVVERRLQVYIDSLPHETAVVDRLGTIVLVNAVWRRFTESNNGVSDRCGLGRNYLDICEASEGEGAATARSVAEGLRNVLSGRADHYAIEYPCHSPREIRWFLMHMAPFPAEDGSIGGAIVTHMNITERKRSEEELRLAARVFESSGEAILITDREERIVSVNPAFVATTGYAPAEVIGRTPRMLSSGRHDNGFYRDMWKTLEASGNWRGEIWNRRRSGETYPEFLSISTVRDLEGRVTHYVAVFSDITNQKRTEDTLRHINAELEQFAYVASHDLREPLRMINAYLTMLERRVGNQLDTEAREFMEFAADGARRMDKLILDLLEFSRVGRQGEPAAPAALETLVENATANLMATIEESAATVELVGASHNVTVDEGEMVRVFQNIIANAIKYSDPTRPPHIRISAEVAGRMLAVTIADNGIGMDHDHLERIFLMFQRLHARNAYGGGTGIGLAIAKKIIERHGGRIWAESQPGEGSRFIFTLPLAR
ncbi:chemotaxis protein CheB [Magnetospirillum sp. UT-4]|uniref:chemotaxis protein CheB n=1 Tax=Magnetospirillum sp. UT-4 TaxID=2681467 RepID=UPI001382A43B|nr:chemotaxis protein CheB [Magnetospirillum sp. UT-4]CAA7614713.1 CheB methylesterase:MCP methyltransferase, CheR-type [Magnetospirillum sp. UT-4]